MKMLLISHCPLCPKCTELRHFTLMFCKTPASRVDRYFIKASRERGNRNVQRLITYVHSHCSVLDVMNIHRIRTNLQNFQAASLELAKLFILSDIHYMHYSSVDPSLLFPQAELVPDCNLSRNSCINEKVSKTIRKRRQPCDQL